MICHSLVIQLLKIKPAAKIIVPTPKVLRAPHLSSAMPAGVEKMAKTIMLTEKINDVLARAQPNSLMSATKKTENDSRMPKTMARLRQQTAMMIQP